MAAAFGTPLSSSKDRSVSLVIEARDILRVNKNFLQNIVTKFFNHCHNVSDPFVMSPQFLF